MKLKEIKEATNDELLNALIDYSGMYTNNEISKTTSMIIIRIKKELLKRLGEIGTYTEPF